MLMYLKISCRGTWVAPSVKCLTFAFDSGHDLTFGELEAHMGLCADSAKHAWDSFSSSLSAPPPLTLSKINFKINLKKIKINFSLIKQSDHS